MAHDPVLCIFDDRSSAVPGMQILVASLRNTGCPFEVVVFCPSASPSVADWLAARKARLVEDLPPGASGWDAKPRLLLQLLDDGYEDVVWLDSDLIAFRDITPALENLPPEPLVVAEEFAAATNHGMCNRARDWGLEPGRDRAASVNSCVVRVTPRHRRLLEEWATMLQSDAYTACKEMDWRDRPYQYFSDQDALGALLGSADYADRDIAYMKRGSDIAHMHGALGHHPGEALVNLLRGDAPLFYHSQRPKAWEIDPAAPSTLLCLQPYTVLARSYLIELNGTPSWLLAETVLSKRIRGVVRNHVKSVALAHALLSCIVAPRTVLSLIRKSVRYRPAIRARGGFLRGR